MNDKDLFSVLEYVGDDLIEEAEKEPSVLARRIQKIAKLTAVLAATLAVAIACAVVVVFSLGRDPAFESTKESALTQTPQTDDSSCNESAPEDEDPSPSDEEPGGDYDTVAPKPGLPTLIEGESYLTIDVNPSFQLAIEQGRVVGVLAVNDDGERILENLDLEGYDLGKALSKVLDELIKQGYLASSAEKAPVMIFSAKGNDSASAILEEAVMLTTDKLAENKVETFIVTQKIEDEGLVVELAERYGVSAGKMQYVLDILEKESDLTLESATAMTIIELFGVDIEKRLIQPPYKVGDRDEYGELVLFAGSVESYAGYVPWEKLSKEYKDELASMYTPEALAILSMPRVWTTIPDVVGLSADEALELLYSRNVAPLICYQDSQIAREQGFVTGQCYMQDLPAGKRHNSDACIHIWILIDEAKEEEPEEEGEKSYDSQYIVESDGKFILTLSFTGDTLEIPEEHLCYLPYIRDDLVDEAVEKLVTVSKVYLSPSEIFMMIDGEGYLCLAVEAIRPTHQENGSEFPEGDPEHGVGFDDFDDIDADTNESLELPLEKNEYELISIPITDLPMGA